MEDQDKTQNKERKKSIRIKQTDFDEKNEPENQNPKDRKKSI